MTVRIRNSPVAFHLRKPELKRCNGQDICETVFRLAWASALGGPPSFLLVRVDAAVKLWLWHNAPRRLSLANRNNADIAGTWLL
jgi:hypothetical protein